MREKLIESKTRWAREGRLLDPSRRARGPIGLGTEFESVREWAPDDDVRHVNWAATQRMARPMTNQQPSRCSMRTGRLPADDRCSPTCWPAATDCGQQYPDTVSRPILRP